ncbi:hypothetical protein pdam_00017152 [Pocillopora damicornis]|uniref:G-protein coupled receptors family 1 profile domain-containing protein n=1 Tax=Pocillopora damicornis TaxID=46731 RepID=A0A3M6UAH2_POCDA|nr:hypothetical protein pdam_00017152 [Pocillopora damicornis]
MLNGFLASPSRLSCCHRRCRPSWKFTGHSNDLYGEKISCDAVGSTCQLSRIRYSIFDPCLTMVVWRNDVYFYLNTALHLIAVSYERYSAIVKSPLMYNSSITRSKVVVIVLIWTVPFLATPSLFSDKQNLSFIIQNYSFAGQLQMPPLFMLPLRHSS